MNFDFEKKLSEAKLRLLKLHYEARHGHLGGNLSCIEALMAIYHFLLGPNDHFILSKGHSAGAWYVALWSKGLISEEMLSSFATDGTTLAAHPSSYQLPGLLFSTGSLGHGPSLSAGLALAAKHKGSDTKVFCLCSDGEWQEGSCWEALIFAAHHKLDNLIIMIDQNGLQGFGTTQEVISCKDLSPRLMSFGVSVAKVNGHSHREILTALDKMNDQSPKVLVLETVKGHGLDNAGLVESHYLPLDEESYRKAVDRIEKGALA